jgi:hypothetical protein
MQINRHLGGTSAKTFDIIPRGNHEISLNPPLQVAAPHQPRVIAAHYIFYPRKFIAKEIQMGAFSPRLKFQRCKEIRSFMRSRFCAATIKQLPFTPPPIHPSKEYDCKSCDHI